MSRVFLFAQVFSLAVLLGVSGCTSDATPSGSGSGGNSSGGVTSSGGSGSGGAGSGGAAGSVGSGGKSGTGGSGSGGAPATGGSTTVASGGVASTGGSIGNGGTTGGGDGGAGGSTSARDGGPGFGGAIVRDGGPGLGGRVTDGGSTGNGSGGQSGGTGTTATGGGSGTGPCKASPCVIFPLGDSITHGLRSSDDAGYRSGLFKLAVAAGQNITFIGSLSSGPSTVSEKPFPKNHEGHDGNTITQMMSYIPPKKAFSTTPHIVLLHIGTNDITNKSDPSTMASQLDTLLTGLVDAAPNALVVVAKIVPLGYNDANYTSYIAKIPDVVKTHASKNQNVIMVDMSTLPTSDIRGSGDVHPSDKGYSDMAGLWYGVIKDYLPK